MRIGELCERSGVSERSLRYYEEQGLLVSERTAGGHRRYPQAAVERVELIQQLYAAGLPSRTIGDLLPCVDTGRSTPDILDGLRTHLDTLDAAISRRTKARQRLAEIIGQTEICPTWSTAP